MAGGLIMSKAQIVVVAGAMLLLVLAGVVAKGGAVGLGGAARTADDRPVLPATGATPRPALGGSSPPAAVVRAPARVPPRRPPPPKLAMAAPTPAPEESAGASPPSGPLDPNTVVAVIRTKMREVAGCYERLVLAHDPDAAGRIEVKFTIRPRDGVGRVSEASIVAPNSDAATAELASPLLQQCLLNALAEATFPPSSEEETEVVFPLDFRPGDDDQ
jgi:hypothetical protein